MANVQNKTLLPLLILRVLEDHSDEKHPLTREKIEEFLYTEYGIALERKSFFRHIEDVRALYNKGPVKICRINIRPDASARTHCAAYYLQNKKLSEVDLRVILDALSGSSYLSQEETEELTDRLISLCPTPLKKKAVSYQRIGYGHKTNNDGTMLNLEAIDKAIAAYKQICLHPVHIKSDGRKVVRKGSGQICTPIQYFVKDQAYYLAAVRSVEGTIRLDVYRLSNIADVEILDTPALDYHSLPAFKHGIDWSKLLREHPGLKRLYEKPVLCTFLCLRWQIEDIKRHFGDELRIRKVSDSEYENIRKVFSGRLEKRELAEVSVITDPVSAAEFASSYTVGMWLVAPKSARKAVCFHLRSRLGQWERLEQHCIKKGEQSQTKILVRVLNRNEGEADSQQQ